MEMNFQRILKLFLYVYSSSSFACLQLIYSSEWDLTNQFRCTFEYSQRNLVMVQQDQQQGNQTEDAKQKSAVRVGR